MSVSNCIMNIYKAQNDDTNVTIGHSSLFECILQRTTNGCEESITTKKNN